MSLRALVSDLDRGLRSGGQETTILKAELKALLEDVLALTPVTPIPTESHEFIVGPVAPGEVDSYNITNLEIPEGKVPVFGVVVTTEASDAAPLTFSPFLAMDSDGAGTVSLFINIANPTDATATGSATGNVIVSWVDAPPAE